MLEKKIMMSVFVLFFGFSGQLMGFDQAAIEQLRRTNRCVGCDLYKANLDNLNLRGADLRGANLKRAKLRKATLLNANLTGAVLYGTNLEGALWTDGSICQAGSIGRCIMEQSNLFQQGKHELFTTGYREELL